MKVLHSICQQIWRIHQWPQDWTSFHFSPKKGNTKSSDGKASAYYVGDLGSIPGSGRSPGERNGNPLWYSCLENPIDGEACRLQSMVGYSLWGRKESDMTERLHSLTKRMWTTETVFISAIRMFCFLMIPVFVGVALLTSFKSLSFAFTTWPTVLCKRPSF